MIHPRISLLEDSLLPVFLWGCNDLDHQHSVHRNSGFVIRGQMSLCTGGEGVFIDANCTPHDVKRGDIMYMMPRASHSYFPKTDRWPVKYLVLGGTDLEGVFFRAGFLPSGILHTQKEDFDEINDLFDRLIRINRSKDCNCFAQSSVVLYELILRAFQSSKDFDEKEKIRKQNKLTPVIHYIDQHYHTPISLNELAEVIGVSAPYLCDIFKKTYHVSPQTYIINMRIEHAKRQLCRNKHMTIKDIALENGFNDAAYFCNVFKKTTGMTPNEFRIANTYRAGKTWEEFN